MRPPHPPRVRQVRAGADDEDARLIEHSISGTVQRVAGLSLAALVVVTILSLASVGGPLAVYLFVRRRRSNRALLTQERLLSRGKSSSSSRARTRVAPAAPEAADFDPAQLVSFGGMITTCLLACVAACSLPCMMARGRRDHRALGTAQDDHSDEAARHGAAAADHTTVAPRPEQSIELQPESREAAATAAPSRCSSATTTPPDTGGAAPSAEANGLARPATRSSAEVVGAAGASGEAGLPTPCRMEDARELATGGPREAA